MYNRNILEYAQIEVTNGNSMILDIEGHSRIVLLSEILNILNKRKIPTMFNKHTAYLET